MVNSLEYLARNEVYKSTFHQMRGKKKKFFIINDDEKNIDQCKNLSRSMTTIKTHRISANSILVILNHEKK